MKRTILVTIALMAIFLGGAYGIQVLLVAYKPEPAQRETESRAPMVSTVQLNPVDVRDILYGFGTAQADREATLTAEVSAPVIERVNNLNVGDRVKVGEALIRLDDRQYRQALQEAESRLAAQDALLSQLRIELKNQGALLEIADADLKLTREEFERVQRLFDSGNAPKSERDSARLRYQVALRARQQIDNQIALIEPRRLQTIAARSGAKAAAQQAELYIERCFIVAPFDGVVDSINVDVGDRVQIGMEMVRIINLDLIEIPVELPVSTRTQAEVGAHVELYVESMPKVRWRGAIVRIAPSADMQSRTYRAYVEVDNTLQKAPLLPGFFVKAIVDGELVEKAIIVPRTSVIDGIVYVANDSKAHVRKVEVIRFIDDSAVLAGDVQFGDKVITSNLDALYDEAPVRVATDLFHASESNGNPPVNSTGLISVIDPSGSVAMEVGDDQ